MDLTATLRRAAARTGTLSALRAAARPLETGWRRRARVDDTNLRLLIALGLDRDANGIDVGANVGEMVDWMVEAAPDGRHVAFEPIPELAEALRARHPGVRVIAAACSDHAGSADFAHVMSRPSISGLKARSETRSEQTQTIAVETVRLDDIVDRAFPPSLIKIDVEGAEVNVLRGSMSTITDFRPMVVFEHGRSTAALYGGVADEIEKLLVGEAGLRLFDLDGRSLEGDGFANVVADGSRWNFVARR